METVFNLFIHYPYPYQRFAFLVSFLIVLISGTFLFVIYRLLVSYMSELTKRRIIRTLKIAGILTVTLVFLELTVSLITIRQVNKQLGFSYATPDTPEGELFEIQKVIPGEIMDKAGLKPLDQVQMHSVSELYKLLIENQGKEALIPVKRDKKEIYIRVNVPDIDVPWVKISFLF